MALLYRTGSAGGHPLRGNGFVLDGVLELLSAQERPVPPARGDEIRVLPLFDDATVVQDDDPARVAHGADAVRRDDRGPAAQGLAKSAQNVGFRVRVDG